MMVNEELIQHIIGAESKVTDVPDLWRAIYLRLDSISRVHVKSVKKSLINSDMSPLLVYVIVLTVTIRAPNTDLTKDFDLNVVTTGEDLASGDFYISMHSGAYTLVLEVDKALLEMHDHETSSNLILSIEHPDEE